jgi:ATP-dependent RNA helicase RhlE
MNFQELKLSQPLLRAVAEAGYTTPSPIQAGAIPPVLAGRDMLGCAQTGTGKTAAFALPMLDRLSARPARKKGAVRALILTPTRELALQIGASFDAYGKYLPLTNTVIFGGVGQAPQVAALRRGVDILIACPGRLNDLVGQGLVDLANVEIFVLDEADRMLDMGFVHDVKKVIAKLPAKRQNLLFSATMPAEIEQLAGSILRDPAFVKVDPVSSTVDRIDQSLYFVSKAGKRQLLPWLIQNLNPPVVNALVFSRTKHGADKIARDLERAGIPAAAIHGNKSQNARVAALEGFKAGKTRVLVATDIAARGIDISELSHVFNYDLPEVPETYVHRIGRTARAGADGTAISFCAPEEREYLAGIEKLNRKKIPVVTGHPFEEDAAAPAVAPVPVQAQPVTRRERGARRADVQLRNASVQEENDMEEKETQEQRAPGNDRRGRRNRRGGGNNQNGRNEQQNAQNNGQQQNARNAAQNAARDRRNDRNGRDNRNANGRNANANARPQANQSTFDPHFLTAPAGGQPLRGAGRSNLQASGSEAQILSPAAIAAQNANRAPQNAPRGNDNGRRRNNGREERRENGRDNRNAARNGNGRNAEPQQPRAERNQSAEQGRNANQRNNRDRNENRREANTQRAPRGGKPEQSGRPAQRAARNAGREDDPGLLLITRRPPQQKFTTFEDYMNAHGGATAPIEDQNDE